MIGSSFRIMMSTSVAQLSCQQCKQRKTKCDKITPCSACIKAGTKCTAVQRHRLPRGRSGNIKQRKPALKDRVSQLEAIISNLSRQEAFPLPEAPHQFASRLSSAEPNTTEQQDASTPNTNDAKPLVAPAFWDELVDAVAGLKEILDDKDDDDDNDVGNVNVDESIAYRIESPSPQMFRIDANHILFGSSVHSSTGSYVHAPSTEMQAWLLDVYRTRVDAIFKVIHWPSFDSLSLNSSASSDLSVETKALELSMYFTALCSLFDHEVADRKNMVEQYRQAAEDAFVEANLLTTTSLTILQAFVVYLAGLRASNANAQQWTLVATAIRIANAQGIPSYLASQGTCIRTELQRRLWHCIGVLDMQSAFDRGSPTMLSSSDLHSLPLKVFDEDIPPDETQRFSGLPERGSEPMIFNLVTFYAGACQRRLTEIGSSASASANGTTIYEQQTAVLSEFQEYARKIPQSPSSPLRSFTLAVAEESLVAMRLLIHRPLYKRYKDFQVPDSEQFDVLLTATQVLERSQMKRTSTEFMQWAWYAWPKWYALAVVLAELCTPSYNTNAERAWSVAKVSFQDYARLVADTKQGMLWKPIAKLMRKVTARRGEAPNESLDSANMSIDLNSSLFDAVDYSTSSLGGYLLDDFPIGADEDMSWLHWEMLTEDITISTI